MISVGDAGVIDSRTMEFPNGRIVSRSIDDRIGAFVILEALRRYADKPGQAKVVAGDIVAELAKKEKFPARYRNTCWSLLAPDDNVKIGANYAPKDGKLEASGGFVSQKGEAADVRKQNYPESVGWYDGITADMFAKATPATAAEKKAG